MPANQINTRYSAYDERRLRDKTMRVSVVEGTFAVFIFSLQQAFYVPYLNAMGATPLQIGIGVCLPTLAAGLFQFLTPPLLARLKGYKMIVTVGSLLHGLFFVPFALVYYIVPGHPIWPSIAAMTIAFIAWGSTISAWIDWMSYIVPRRRRGKYFALRNRIITITQLIIAVVAAHTLDHITSKTILVFTGIWVLCFITRTASSICLLYYHEPPIINRPRRNEPGFLQFAKEHFTTSFGKFVVGLSLMNLGIYLSSPFYTIYMLNDLHLSYSKYIVLYLMPILMTALATGPWGRICDRFGYIIPVRLSAIMLAMPGLLWVVTDNYWLLMITQAISGIALGGFLMATFNYIMGALGPTNRVSSISYLYAINLPCMALGSLLGGVVGPYLPRFSDHQLHGVFILASIICLFASMLFQLIREEWPFKNKLNAVERFFFDPRFSLGFGTPSAGIAKHKHNR